MKLKIISILVIVLIIGINFNLSFALAQIEGSTGSPEVGNFYDSDGDGICSEPRGSTKHEGKTGFNMLNCNDNAYGDLCPGTRADDRPVGSGFSNSGCGPSQAGRLANFWSVSKGKITPAALKVNWITDTRNGVLAYQEIDLIRNPIFADKNVELRSVNINCDSGVGIDKTSGEYREIPGGFISDARAVPMINSQANSQNEKRMIQFRVRQRPETGSDSDIRSKGAIVKDSENRIRGIDEIRTTCRVRIDQCVQENENCVPVYPVEQDEIDFFIPIDTLALQPPEFALDAGIATAEEIIKFTNKLIPTFDKWYKFTLRWCGYSIAAVLAAKIGNFLIKGLSDIADTIWYGPKGYRSIGFEKSSFVISGRSMCAAAVCPKNWCRFASIGIGEKQVQEYIDLDHDGKVETPVWETDDKGEIKYYSGKDGGTTTKPIPKLVTEKITLGSRASSIQDSIILSAGCACVSGILINLYELRAIADSWRACLLEAKTGGTYTAQCDKLLNHGICKFVLEELESFHGTDIIKKAFDFTRGGGAGDGSTRGPEQDVREAIDARSRFKDSVAEASQFTKEDLAELGRAAGGGVLGYDEFPLAQTICSLAIYQRLPGIDSFTRYDLNRPILKTSISLNWDSEPLLTEDKQVYRTPTGERLFEYSVDWMILAGKDNLQYEVYLETENGMKSPRLDRQGGFLGRIGDYHTDFVQILDTVDYSKACVRVPNEFPEPRCFLIGQGGDDTIFGEFRVYDGEMDSDNDGMLDEWESEMGFDSNDPSDAARDYDSDGLTNVREYSLGTDPKNANDPGSEPIDVGFSRSDCQAVFTSDISFIGKTGVIPQYRFGERIEVNPVNLIQITRPNEGVQIKIEIEGEDNSFSKTVRINAHDVANNARFTVWNIPQPGSGVDVPDTGLYKIKFSLIKDAALSDPLCGDENGRIANSVKEKRVVIYNPSFKGCVDSGGYDISRQQTCVSGNGNVGVYVEECSNDKLVEYSCQQNQCVQQTVSCPIGSVCQGGRCVLRSAVTAPISVAPVAVVPAPITGYGEQYSTEPTVGGVFTVTKNNLGYPGGETYVYIKNTVNEVFGNENALPLILGMITQESGGNKQAGSSAGAFGLMQIMPDAQSDVNNYLFIYQEQPIDSKNRNVWQDNIYIGVTYFKLQLDKYKNIELALAAYNHGPTNIDNRCKNKTFDECKSSLPLETQNYVPAVLKHAEAWRRELTAVAST